MEPACGKNAVDHLVHCVPVSKPLAFWRHESGRSSQAGKGRHLPDAGRADFPALDGRFGEANRDSGQSLLPTAVKVVSASFAIGSR